MEQKVETAWKEIVFAVTRLIFGDSSATNPVYQSVVAKGLEALNIQEILQELAE